MVAILTLVAAEVQGEWVVYVIAGLLEVKVLLVVPIITVVIAVLVEIVGIIVL